MKDQPKFIRILYIIGVITLIVGTIDPLEGSVLIAIGSALLALSTSLAHDRHRKLFIASFAMNVIGIFFLFYFSSLGGFPPLSYWLAILIIPYPAGWLMAIIILIMRAVKQSKTQKVA